MTNDLELQQRYLRARFYVLEVARRPTGANLSYLITEEFRKVGRELAARGIEYQEMGRPNRAPSS